MFHRSIVNVRVLYLILVLMFVAGCSSQENAAQQIDAGQKLPTIPVEWLTKPPTPEITPSVMAIEQSVVQNPLDTPTAHPGTDVEEPTIEVPTALPTEAGTATPLIVPTQALEKQLSITADAAVPKPIADAAKQLSALRPNDFQWVEPSSGPADIHLQAGSGTPIANWVYIAAAPFATFSDSVPFEELQDRWTGAETADSALIISENTAAALATVWGEPGAEVQRISSEELKDRLWDQRPSLTIIPFDQLTPDLKAMQIDGISPISHEFSTEEYPLVVTVGITAEDAALRDFLSAWPMPPTNRDPNKLTRLAMTGVTALVRATASNMETNGILTAGEDVRLPLLDADITHISNEVAFAEDCPEPNPVGGSTFCSQDEYFSLLEDIGADVIELTGNHLNDWGPESFRHTMEMYEKANMQTFGGGLNLEKAAEPAIIEHNGNKIAFVGCNIVGPNYAWAGPTSPGSQPCGPEFDQQVRDLSNAGYTVIATLQYYEFYHYEPTGLQEEDFRVLIDAGASAVSGSQGHHAQGFDFHNDAFIHYGLGNLFFDQMFMDGTRQSFVDTYAIYDGELVNVELWTGLIEDYYKPRLMTADERQQALEAVFEASGW